MKSHHSSAFDCHPRLLLKASCAVPALLVLPASLAFVAPAAAQTVISTNQYATVNLSASTNPFTITAGSTLSPGGASGVFGAGGTVWDINNAGDIDAGGDGIQLQSSAMVTNTGTITGADALIIYGAANVSNAGIISGGPAGIRLQQGGSVSNTGLITASGYGILTQGAAADVANSGTIIAGNDGISLNHGGTVANSGTISAFHMGIYTGHGAGTVENAGLVKASFGDAVSLYGGGTFTNTATGTLAGGYSGLYAAGASALTNAGVISGTTFGVYLNGASSLTNTGIITGGLDGVIDVGAHGLLINSGDITGTVNGVRMGAAGTIMNSGSITGGVTGVTLATGGALTNAANGVIAGGVAGVRAVGNAQIDNEGTILGGVTLGGGSMLDDTGLISGPTAIALTGTDDLVLDTGADIDGAITGGNGASQITLAGTGTLASAITGFGAGSALRLAPGADWTASGTWQVANIVNDGTLQPGVAGQTLSLTGNFTEGADGTLRIAVSPAGLSTLAVTGNASLNGHLVYVLAPGAYVPGTASFLTATGGVTGGFASTVTLPTNNAAPQLATQAPVQVTSAPVAATAPQTPAASPSQTAPSVNATPVSATETTAAPTLAPAAAVPVTYATVSTTSVSLVFSQSFTVAPSDDALYADNAQDMAQAADRAGTDILGHAAAPSAAPCLPAASLPAGRSTAGIAGALAAAACRMGGWAEATGTSASLSDAYNSQAAGFLAGLDRSIGAARVGVAVGYDGASLKDSDGGTADTDTLRLGLYAAQPVGALILAGEVQDDFATTRVARDTGIGTASARPHANIVQGAVAISAPIDLGNLTVLPAAGLRIAHLTTGTAQESAPVAGFALAVGQTHLTSLRPYATVTLATQLVTGGTIITPSLTLGASYEAGDNTATDSLATSNTIVAASSRPMDRANGLAGVGVTASRGNWSLSARYTVQGGGNNAAQTVQAAMQMAF